MPRGNGTGPTGMGPMTGRGAGCCTSATVTGLGAPAMRCGMGRGFGHGYRRMFQVTGVPGWMRSGKGTDWDASNSNIEKASLITQVENLENQLLRTKARLKSLNEKAD
jgi:hypothetical protein